MALQSNSDWASLPDNLLNSILDHLAPVAECIRFSAVCSEWRRTACENFGHLYCNLRYPRPHQHQLPLLMVPTPDNSTNRRSLYDVRRKSLYDFQVKVPYNRRCGGSSRGWLIFVDDSFEVTLFNPFSGKAIHLPPIKRLAFEKRIRDEIDEMWALPDLQKYEYERQLREEYDEEEKKYVPDDSEESEDEDEVDQEQDTEDEDEEEENEAQEFNEKFLESEKYVPDLDELEIYDDSEESEDEDEVDQEQDTEDEDEEKNEAQEFNERFLESEYSIERGVLSANPEINPDDYILMVIYGTEQRLAFIKSGDKNWTYIDKNIDQNICDFVETTFSDVTNSGLWNWKDIVYSNGLFYVLDHWGVLLSCDVSSNLKVKRATGPDRLHISYNKKTYLVESSEGDILRVVRVIDDEDNYMTIKFVVYKLVDFVGNPEWTKVNSLGNDALFLGDNHSTSVLASDFVGCQPNSIYFCDDCIQYYYRGGPNDIGVFNLQDGCVTQHYTLAPSQRLMPPSIWISPTFL